MHALSSYLVGLPSLSAEQCRRACSSALTEEECEELDATIAHLKQFIRLRRARYERTTGQLIEPEPGVIPGLFPAVGGGKNRQA